jgi:predicted ATPase
MAYPDARIYRFSNRGINPIAYEDTENVRVTRDFLADPEAMIRRLFA